MSQFLQSLVGLIVLAAIVYGIVLLSRKRSSARGTSTGGRARSQSSGQAEGLGFIVNGKDPEVDSKGRVVVRLDSGAPHEWRVNVRFDHDYLTGRAKPKDDSVDEKSRTVRARLSRVDGTNGTFFEVRTPDGDDLGLLAGDGNERALEFFDILERALRPMDSRLATCEFVYDVGLKVELILSEEDEDGNEVLSWEFDAAFVRIKDPAGIEIL